MLEVIETLFFHVLPSEQLGILSELLLRGLSGGALSLLEDALLVFDPVEVGHFLHGLLLRLRNSNGYLIGGENAVLGSLLRLGRVFPALRLIPVILLLFYVSANLQIEGVFFGLDDWIPRVQAGIFGIVPAEMHTGRRLEIEVLLIVKILIGEISLEFVFLEELVGVDSRGEVSRTLSVLNQPLGLDLRLAVVVGISLKGLPIGPNFSLIRHLGDGRVVEVEGGDVLLNMGSGFDVGFEGFSAVPIEVFVPHL